jgi:hypothetical protein
MNSTFAHYRWVTGATALAALAAAAALILGV